MSPISCLQIGKIFRRMKVATFALLCLTDARTSPSFIREIGMLSHDKELSSLPGKPWASGQSGRLQNKGAWVQSQLVPNVFLSSGTRLYEKKLANW